ATLGAEEYLGRADRLGTIEPGKLADFFLVAGDPTADISAVRRPRLVVQGGVVYYPHEIYAALDIRPFTAPPPVARAAGAAPWGGRASPSPSLRRCLPPAPRRRTRVPPCSTTRAKARARRSRRRCGSATCSTSPGRSARARTARCRIPS